MARTGDVSLYTSQAGSRSEIARVATTRAFEARFEIDRLLGAGAMGCVYLARDHVLKTFVAVKFLTNPGGGPADPTSAGGGVGAQLRERFVREARLLAGLRHPHVVGVIDADCLGEYPYLVCEFVDGGTLRALLDHETSLPPARAVEIGVEILAGLAACHESGVVHRDIKPENVLLDLAGTAKIADLGIAKDYGEMGSRLTRTGMLMGTPAYMSPEQARGEPAVPASDLYSTGVVLYELLSGRPPFLATSLTALLRAHRDEEPVPLTAAATGVSEALAAVVHRALAKHADERPGSAPAMAAALERALRPPSRPAARPVSGSVSVPPRAPVSRAGAFAGLLAATVLLAAADALVSPRPAASPAAASVAAPATPASPAVPDVREAVANLHRDLEVAPQDLEPWPGHDREKAEVPLVVTCLSHASTLAASRAGALALPSGQVLRGAASLPVAEAGLEEGINWLTALPRSTPRVTLLHDRCALRPQQLSGPPPEGLLHGRITAALQESPLDQGPAQALLAQAIPDAANPFRLALAERIEIDGGQYVVQIGEVAGQGDEDPLITDEALVARIRHALDEMQRALRRDPTRWDLWHDTGYFLRRVGALDAARVALVRSLMIWPESAMSWRELARLERRSWRHARAAADGLAARAHLAAAIADYERALASRTALQSSGVLWASALVEGELAALRKAAR